MIRDKIDPSRLHPSSPFSQVELECDSRRVLESLDGSVDVVTGLLEISQIIRTPGVIATWRSLILPDTSVAESDLATKDTGEPVCPVSIREDLSVKVTQDEREGKEKG